MASHGLLFQGLCAQGVQVNIEEVSEFDGEGQAWEASEFFVGADYRLLQDHFICMFLLVDPSIIRRSI